MDNPKFPHGNNVPLGIDELNMAFRQGIEPGGNTFNGMNDFLGDDIPFPTDDLLPPDTYGAERLFIEYFVCDDMTDDFPLIARDFYLHEFANIMQYEDLIEAEGLKWRVSKEFEKDRNQPAFMEEWK